MLERFKEFCVENLKAIEISAAYLYGEDLWRYSDR